MRFVQFQFKICGIYDQNWGKNLFTGILCQYYFLSAIYTKGRCFALLIRIQIMSSYILYCKQTQINSTKNFQLIRRFQSSIEIYYFRKVMASKGYGINTSKFFFLSYKRKFVPISIIIYPRQIPDKNLKLKQTTPKIGKPQISYKKYQF